MSKVSCGTMLISKKPAAMNGSNRNRSKQITKPSQPPPPPPIQCHQAKAGPVKGAVTLAVERLQKKSASGQGSHLTKINGAFSKKINFTINQPKMPNPNWNRADMAGPPPVPITPSCPPPAYNYPMKIPPNKPPLGPKPGDLLLLQNFFGLRTPLDLESARRLACSTSRDGSTPLHQAARESRAKEVGALIRMGAPVDAEDALGYRPVHKAAAAGSVRVLQLLKFVGADLQAEGNHGYRPIHRAAMNGGMEAVRWLVEQGCPVDAAISGGWTALHLAVWWDREPVVRCLLDLGASVNYMTDRGQSPLSVAISSRHEDLVRLLVSYGGVVE